MHMHNIPLFSCGTLSGSFWEKMRSFLYILFRRFHNKKHASFVLVFCLPFFRLCQRVYFLLLLMEFLSLSWLLLSLLEQGHTHTVHGFHNDQRKKKFIMHFSSPPSWPSWSHGIIWKLSFFMRKINRHQNVSSFIFFFAQFPSSAIKYTHKCIAHIRQLYIYLLGLLFYGFHVLLLYHLLISFLL